MLARTPPSDPFGLIRRTHAFVGEKRRTSTGGPQGGSGASPTRGGGGSGSGSGGGGGGGGGKRFSFFGGKAKSAVKNSYDSSGVDGPGGGGASASSNLGSHRAIERFWTVYSLETGASPLTLGNQSPRTVQLKMVRAFRNYRFAKAAWGLVVVPTLARLASIGSIEARSKQAYQQMVPPTHRPTDPPTHRPTDPPNLTH